MPSIDDDRDDMSEFNMIQYEHMAKEHLVTLNLRGTIFKTNRERTKQLPESYLHRFISSRRQEEHETEFFFDRNPTIFHAILDYYSTGHLHVPPGVCVENLKEELLFWGVKESSVPQCCWRRISKTKECIAILEELAKLKNITDSQNGQTSRTQRCRFRVWEFLNYPHSSSLAKAWFFFVIIVSVSSVLVYGLASIITVPRPTEEIPDYNFTGSKIQEIRDRKAHLVLIWIELVTNTFLFFDIILRLWCSPSIRKFLLDYINIFEFLSVLSSYFNMYAYNNLQIFTSKTVLWIFNISGVFFIGRVLRILRLSRHYKEMTILGLCFRSCKRELTLLALSFLAFSLVLSAMMLHAQADSPNFKNLFVCYWWSVITMTTVGYGDEIPDTVLGHCVAIVAAVFGVLSLAMPVAIISSAFNQYHKCFKIQERYLQQKEKMLNDDTP